MGAISLTINIPTLVITLIAVLTIVYQVGRLIRHFEARFDMIDEKLRQHSGRFDTIDARFNAVEQRLDAIEQRLDAVEEELKEIRSTQREILLLVHKLHQNFLEHLTKHHQIS